jgi:hypothetical protein
MVDTGHCVIGLERTLTTAAFVIVPSMMPRPVLKDNFNITYRKIPVLFIGREVGFEVPCEDEHSL